MDAINTLRSLGSVARTREIVGRGVSRRQIERHVAVGEMIRPRAGVIALPDARPDYVTAVLNDGRLTCLSAATAYNLWLLRPAARLHLSCSHGRGTGFTNHRQRTVPVHPREPLLGVVDVLVHALRCLPPLEAAVMVECSLRRGDTIRSFLLDRLPGDRNSRARATLAKVSCAAESPLEVVARFLFVEAGFHVETQVPLAGVGRVDFLLEGFLVIEVDGAAYHSDRRALRRDLHRNNSTIVGGYLVLRYIYEDVMFHPDDVLREIRQVLAGRAIR
ncbi:endonuclease domain-containing protein [Arthrobacter sp. Hz1]